MSDGTVPAEFVPALDEQLTLERAMTPDVDQAVRRLPIEPPDFSPSQADRVAMVDVPAFDENGQVALVLGSAGFDDYGVRPSSSAW